jgi:hypothetical protein
LLIDRHAEIDGNHYGFLVPAAEALEEKHPLAATLALRGMIDFTLIRARAKRYGHAARHLATCAALASRIADFAPFETHGLPRQTAQGTWPEVRLLVEGRGAMVVLPEHQAATPWRHGGSTRARTAA